MHAAVQVRVWAANLHAPELDRKDDDAVSLEAEPRQGPGELHNRLWDVRQAVVV
jgi:hypothetical protein